MSFDDLSFESQGNLNQSNFEKEYWEVNITAFMDIVEVASLNF